MQASARGLYKESFCPVIHRLCTLATVLVDEAVFSTAAGSCACAQLVMLVFALYRRRQARQERLQGAQFIRSPLFLLRRCL